MLSLEYTKAFERDVKRLKKRGKNLGKLTGNFKDHWECHVEPDFLLVSRKNEETLVLVRTGTHSDLF